MSRTVSSAISKQGDYSVFAFARELHEERAKYRTKITQDIPNSHLFFEPLLILILHILLCVPIFLFSEFF
jgi:hypothetical protein